MNWAWSGWKDPDGCLPVPPNQVLRLESDTWREPPHKLYLHLAICHLSIY